MNAATLPLTFFVAAHATLDTLEAVLATARRGGLRLRAMRVDASDRSNNQIFADFAAADADLLDLFLSRLRNLYEVNDVHVLSSTSPGLAQPGPLQAESVQPGSVQPGFVQPDSVQRDSVQPDSVQPGLAQAHHAPHAQHAQPPQPAHQTLRASHDNSHFIDMHASIDNPSIKVARMHVA